MTRLPLLGVAPSAQTVSRFLTRGLDLGVAVPVYYEGNTAIVEWRDKRYTVLWRDKRQPVTWRDKRVWIDAT